MSDKIKRIANVTFQSMSNINEAKKQGVLDPKVHPLEIFGSIPGQFLELELGTDDLNKAFEDVKQNLSSEQIDKLDSLLLVTSLALKNTIILTDYIRKIDDEPKDAMEIMVDLMDRVQFNSSDKEKETSAIDNLLNKGGIKRN